MSSVGSHNLAAERFLFIRNFNHVNLAVQTEIGTSHRKGGTPLTGSCFSCYTFQSLLFGIISLGNRRI